jgi:hypothetical protein
MPSKISLCALFGVAVALLPVAPASARSSIRVGLADQSPAMFDSPLFQRLNVKRTRYFVPSDVMQNSAERATATAFVRAARGHGVSTLLHISTTDLREKRGRVVSATSYRRNVGRIVSYFRKLGVRDFGAWDEVNRNRSSGTRKIILTARRYNRSTKFWFTETGALASFRGSFPYSLTRQASRIRNMFSLANRFRRSGVQRVYAYNWSGIDSGPGCGRSCLFDSGLTNPDGTARPVYGVFASKLASYSR